MMPRTAVRFGLQTAKWPRSDEGSVARISVRSNTESVQTGANDPVTTSPAGS